MTNGAAIGYMILAAERAGYNSKTIKELEALMLGEMDFVTEEEAERYYKEIRR